jgi:hypothetical protein
MSETKPPQLQIVESDNPSGRVSSVPPKIIEELDEDERLLRELRVDMPGGGGDAIADSVVAFGVGKIPKDTFFRCCPGVEFQPELQMITNTVGFEKTFVAVKPSMVDYLRSIKIYTAKHRVYLIATEEGMYRLVPVRLAARDGGQNVFSRTLQIAMRKAESEWVRVYNDPELKDTDRGWQVYVAPPGRFPEPNWSGISPGKLVRLGFKDSDNLIDSTEHPLVNKYMGKV